MAYSYSNVKPDGAGNNTNNLFAVGVAFLGFTVIGVGVCWWGKCYQVREEDENDPASSDMPTLDELITEIALLDETYGQKRL